MNFVRLRDYYDFEIRNDTDQSIFCEKIDSRNDNAIPDCENYCLGISRFSLPIQQADSFKVRDNSTYLLKIGAGITTNNTNSPQSDIIPYDLSYQSSLPTNSQFTYRNGQNDFIEAFNRTSLSVHRNFNELFTRGNAPNMNFANTSYYESNTNISIGIHNGDRYYDVIIPESSNFGDRTVGADNLCAVQIVINMGKQSDPTGDTPRPVKVWLIAPDGTKCLVTKMADCNYNNTYTFLDESFVSQHEQMNITKALPAGTYQPLESFVKLFKTTPQNGNYIIRVQDDHLWARSIDYDGTFTLDFDVKLKIYFSPVTYVNNLIQPHFNQYAPTLQFNDTTKKVEMLLHESFFYQNMYIKVSPMLFNVLGFDGVYDVSDGFYRLTFPQVLLSPALSNTTFITYSQAVGTSYRMNQIRQVQIRTNLPTAGQLDSSSNSPILISVDVPVDSVNDRFDYSSTSDGRLYDIIGRGAIKNLGFSVWLYYNDGHSELCQLPPKSLFTMLIQFVRKDLYSIKF